MEEAIKKSAVDDFFHSRTDENVEVTVPSRFQDTAKKSGFDLGPARKIQVSQIEPSDGTSVLDVPADPLPSSVQMKAVFVPGVRSNVDDVVAQYLMWKWKNAGRNPKGTFRDFLFQTFPDLAHGD